MNKQTQKRRVIDWLKTHGTLTVREAVTELNIMSVPKRVEELRKDGYPIGLTWATSSTGARYGVYVLYTNNEEATV